MQRVVEFCRVLSEKEGSKSMSKAFFELLVELAEDPLRALEFKANPDPMLKGAGLSKEEEEALRSRNANRIRGLLAEPPPEQDLLLLTWFGSILDEEGEGGT